MRNEVITDVFVDAHRRFLPFLPFFRFLYPIGSPPQIATPASRASFLRVRRFPSAVCEVGSLVCSESVTTDASVRLRFHTSQRTDSEPYDASGHYALPTGPAFGPGPSTSLEIVPAPVTATGLPGAPLRLDVELFGAGTLEALFGIDLLA